MRPCLQMTRTLSKLQDLRVYMYYSLNSLKGDIWGII